MKERMVAIAAMGPKPACRRREPMMRYDILNHRPVALGSIRSRVGWVKAPGTRFRRCFFSHDGIVF
jgi:hypothetical protein